MADPVISIANARTTEGSSSSDPNFVTFEILLSDAAASEITFDWRVIPGSTIDHFDFNSQTFQSGSITVPAGDSSVLLSLRIDADVLDEADDSFVLELSGLVGAQFEGGGDRLTATGFILDDDGSGENRVLAVSSPELIEGDTGSQIALFHLSLSRAATQDLSFDFQTLDGSALAGEDYVATSGTVTFLAGQLEAIVEVQV
ncbi:MAG: hypothetical protein KDH15_11285, partial [Rhodocyclaceae bacterium]|nr:hypothetical protein [Rhodocyclaceae bacterium]